MSWLQKYCSPCSHCIDPTAEISLGWWEISRRCCGNLYQKVKGQTSSQLKPCKFKPRRKSLSQSVDRWVRGHVKKNSPSSLKKSWAPAAYFYSPFSRHISRARCHYKVQLNVYVHVCGLYYFHKQPTQTHLPCQRCQFTDVALSLLVVQRSPRASTLHFPGCRGAGQGQDSMLFSVLMKHVYLRMCVSGGRDGRSEMWVCVCVSKCIIFFLDQNDTLTSQRLMHHSIAKQQSDIYGRLMLFISYSCVPQGEKKVKKTDYKERRSPAFIFKEGHASFFSFCITRSKNWCHVRVLACSASSLVTYKIKLNYKIHFAAPQRLNWVKEILQLLITQLSDMFLSEGQLFMRFGRSRSSEDDSLRKHTTYVFVT